MSCTDPANAGAPHPEGEHGGEAAAGPGDVPDGTNCTSSGEADCLKRVAMAGARLHLVGATRRWRARSGRPPTAREEQRWRNEQARAEAKHEARMKSEQEKVLSQMKRMEQRESKRLRRQAEAQRMLHSGPLPLVSPPHTQGASCSPPLDYPEAAPAAPHFRAVTCQDVSRREAQYAEFGPPARANCKLSRMHGFREPRSSCCGT